MTFDLDAAVKTITLIFAGAAALVSWLGYKKSGSQKIAQFRKEWIENLRSHLAEYNSLRFQIITKRREFEKATKAGRGDRQRELRASIDASLQRLSYVLAYIRLMLNKGEPLHDELLDLINQHTEKKYDLSREDRRSFSDKCRAVLKAEWEKAKSEM